MTREWTYQFTCESMRTALYEKRVGDYDRFIVCRLNPEGNIVVEGWCKPSLATRAREVLENRSRETGAMDMYEVFEFEPGDISKIHAGAWRKTCDGQFKKL